MNGFFDIRHLSTLYRRREEVRMKALTSSNAVLTTASALQLCYDGRVIDKIDRYVFLGQFVDDKLEPCKSVMHVKSIPKTISVTAGVIFNTITEEISNQCLQNVILSWRILPFSTQAKNLALIHD